MKKYEQIKTEVEKFIQQLVGNKDCSEVIFSEIESEVLRRKLDTNKKRKVEIVKSHVTSNVNGETKEGIHRSVDYTLHFKHLIKQQKGFYIEEEVQHRRAVFSGDRLVKNIKIEPDYSDQVQSLDLNISEDQRNGYQYDRRAAVQYAEQWWNSYNPKYKKFEVDCTNYISQCVHAGGAPMTGFTNRSKGWWYNGNNWSYSWSVAHAFRWYLSGSSTGLQAREVESATDLLLGDLICYDFEGDGRWNHSTIVTAKDENNEPLVNAHTSNSRMRYWKYEDSSAWTPNIKYKFFHIIDG